jgi:hypothetical protein
VVLGRVLEAGADSPPKLKRKLYERERVGTPPAKGARASGSSRA